MPKGRKAQVRDKIRKGWSNKKIIAHYETNTNFIEEIRIEEKIPNPIK